MSTAAAAPVETADNQEHQLWSTSCHYRITRRGKIFKSVSERYLRDDLGLGFYMSQSSSTDARRSEKTDSGPIKIQTTEELLSLLVQRHDSSQEIGGTSLIICDTNVLLHNMDVLEHPSMALANIVIPQTSLQECRKNSLSHYNRCMELLRTGFGVTDNNSKSETTNRQRCVIFFPDNHHVDTQLSSMDTGTLAERLKALNQSHHTTENDINDLRIRRVAVYFGSHLAGSHVQVILLTDDRQCRQLARMEQKEDYDSGTLYKPQSVREHVQELEKHNPYLSLLDVVSQTSLPSSGTTSTRVRSGPAVELFEKHMPLSQILMGVKTGKYYQGTIRCSDRSSYAKCYVTIRQGDERVAVAINGIQDVNRAVDGDVVVIELHPMERWISSSSVKGDIEKKTKESNRKTDKEVAIAMETAEPTIRDEDNVQDTVLVPEDQTKNLVSMKPTGKVVGIVRRNFRQNYCGSIYSHEVLADDEGETNDSLIQQSSERLEISEACEAEHADGTFTCVFFAVDKRVPPILIRTSQRGRLVGNRLLVAIDSWPVESLYPLGHYVRTLGKVGSKDVETEVVLHEHNIPCDPFPAKVSNLLKPRCGKAVRAECCFGEASSRYLNLLLLFPWIHFQVLACLPPPDYNIDADNSPGRLDLRGLPVLSIDPPGCKDIDDALHCVLLPNGNYQVGVHIADVTHYIQAGSAIDLEAANRSTSTYLVNKRLDMLPSLLTTDLCSLKGNVDRCVRTPSSSCFPLALSHLYKFGHIFLH